ncbi:hypothetical protein [Hoeflea sp.]|uniref:hypothetical protein n=1 Tax=Hoeflea sp. TaxID=1940281 RepID=UPI003A935745
MTIAVIWQEDGVLWCAADTRLVVGKNDQTTSEKTAKIYSIPLSVCALNPVADLTNTAFGLRQPHYWTQYGFAYAGAALPATQTAVTATTLLQNLARPGDRTDPPAFEEIAELMCRLARRFMDDKRRFGADGKFQAAFFGWCAYTTRFKVAHIHGRDDLGAFRVELSYPKAPDTEGDPWLILGSGAATFESTLTDYRRNEQHIKKRIPRRVIDQMVAEDRDPSVGGATSIGAANKHGFDLFYAVEPIVRGQPAARRIFNGLDLDTEVGPIGQYIVAAIGVA